jgi:hypothetical protein
MTHQDTDTIAMAALLKALQVTIDTAIRNGADLAALEKDVIRAIKGLDASEFGYDEQADGLGEGLQLVSAMFRLARHQLETALR